MQVREILAQNVKQIKKERGLTQFDLSELTGLSVREIGKIERSQVSITLDTLQKLADGLGVTVIKMISEQYNVSRSELYQYYHELKER